MATVKKKMQAGGVSKKSPKAPMVDPKGAWTKVQERTLGNMKKGGKIKKAQSGKEVIKGSRPGLGVFRTEKERTTVGGIAKPYKYKRESIDTTGYSKGKSNYQLKTEEGEGDKTGYRKVTNSKSKTIPKKEVMSTLSSLKMKSGGKVEDKKWIQKAVNPKHKGYCTPMTKATCTPKRKALAMTFKKMAKARKKK